MIKTTEISLWDDGWREERLEGLVFGETRFVFKSLLFVVHILTSRKVVKCPGQVGKQSTFGIGFQNVVGQISFINSFAEYQGEHNQF
jgi:hypothetical protein